MLFCCRSKQRKDVETKHADTTAAPGGDHSDSTEDTRASTSPATSCKDRPNGGPITYDTPAYNPVDAVLAHNHESGGDGSGASSASNSRIGMGPSHSRASTVTSQHTLNTTQRVYCGGERKCVRLRLAERTVSVPGDFHKAPAGAEVLFFNGGKWVPGRVAELHSEGTCDITFGKGAEKSLEHGVRPDFIRTPDATYTPKCLQGRWYDGEGATWDVQDLNVRETRTDAIIRVKALCHVGESGLIALDGVKVHTVTKERVVWADGVVWRRARGREVIMPIEDRSVQWGQTETGMVVTSADPTAPVCEGEVLHSVDGASISSRDCFTKYIYQAASPNLRLLVCPPQPHPPIPAPFFDTTFVKTGDEASALWGGAYHPCIIQSSRICKDPGSNEDTIYTVKWTFYDPHADILHEARKGSVEAGCWENSSISMRGGAGSTGPLAEAIRSRYQRAYEAYFGLCSAAQDGHTTDYSPSGSSPRPALNGTLRSNGGEGPPSPVSSGVPSPLANGGGGSFEGVDAPAGSLTFGDLVCALRLTKLSARQHLKELVRPCGKAVPMRDWLMWMGHLSEEGLAENMLAWVESHINGESPQAPPAAGGVSPATQYPPTQECVLLLPGRGKVVGDSGSVARSGEAFTTEEVGTLPRGTLVDISEVVGRRAKVVAPLVGWVSLTTADGDMLISEHPVMPGVDQGDLVHCEDEPAGCVWEGSMLEDVLDNSPASRGCLRRFIGRELLSLNGEPVDPATGVNTLIGTFSTLCFSPLNSVVAVIRKLPEESLGITFGEHNVLESVENDSAADRAAFTKYIGRTATHVDGVPVKTLADIALLSRGVTSATFTFTDNRTADIFADTVHTISDLAAVGSPPTILQHSEYENALPSIADLVGECILDTDDVAVAMTDDDAHSDVDRVGVLDNSLQDGPNGEVRNENGNYRATARNPF